MRAGGPSREGLPEPLGARLDPEGANLAVHAPEAQAVEVCLFAPDGRTETARIGLAGRTGPVWHGRIPGLAEGALYGLRAHGPWRPSEGLRFNPAKLLVDPYALRLDRPPRPAPSMSEAAPDGARDPRDSGPDAPKAILSRPPTPLRRRGSPPAWSDTVIYELHVRGFTRLHPDIPPEIRGTFRGLAHPAAIAHLKALGVTTIELMPAAAWIDEPRLGPLGLTNYWGYNPVAWLAPDPRLAPGGWPDVRAATDALAAAGLETVLDMVFNHTGEGDASGPTVSLRGLDNRGYYRLRADDRAQYVNDAGTGNTLACDRPSSIRLILDSLRAWRRFGGIDGFRFDLAATLGRRDDGFDPVAPVFAAIDQDPELRGLKRIAEPWDTGPGGYRLGAFPPAWGEWNDRFRDDIRGFWRGDPLSRGTLARRLAGSEDIFAGRRPSRSVNYVTAHDGFTLADLVTYATKRNAANGEDGRDGTDHNLSIPTGPDGPSDDAQIVSARRREQRALLSLLILARGTPMLSMGDEVGRSQGGNNNAYAQDNPTSWFDWANADPDLSAFTARLIALRRTRPALRSDRFLTGDRPTGEPAPDVAWLGGDGRALDVADWDAAGGETLAAILAAPDAGGQDRVAIAVHRGAGPCAIPLPPPSAGRRWRILSDSADPDRDASMDDDRLDMSARSVVLAGEVRGARRRSGPSDTEIARLAAAAGISPEWTGFDGARTRVTPETQRALLAAMGLAAPSGDAARDLTRWLADDLDRRILPYGASLQAGAPGRVRVRPFADGRAPRGEAVIEDAAGDRRVVALSDALGEPVRVADRDGSRFPAYDLALPPLPEGRYRMRLEAAPDAVAQVVASPARAFSPEDLTDRRFGISAQLYALKRDGDQGVGDFTTLARLAETAGAEGARYVFVNPLHALFPNDRTRASPYYPSDRRRLDPMQIDLARVTGANPEPLSGRRASADRIDHGTIWREKAHALEAAFAAFPGDPEFERFVRETDTDLLAFARFEAIAEAHGGDWRRWPAGLEDPEAPEVAAFAEAKADRVRFHLWLQWLCECQLGAARGRARELGVGVGLDLAVGAAPDGAEAWSLGRRLARGVSLGAPPDPFSSNGQVWGLAPLDPLALVRNAAPFQGLLAANMRHADALRIDHAMGLERQFWTPDGADGSAGAYVAFPAERLFAEVRLESARNACLVVAEDLGTVPEGFRDRLTASGIYGWRVLPFEIDGGRARSADAYPVLSVACAATHDLPPVAGWWSGVDIEERRALGLTSDEAADAARAERGEHKTALLGALAAAGLLPPHARLDADMDDALAAAIHALVARTASRLALVQAEDLAAERIGVNLPGTDRERENWRRRTSVPVERLAAGARARAIFTALRAARPGPAQ